MQAIPITIVVFVFVTSVSCQTCTTTGETQLRATTNTPCTFPFVYKGESFNGCTEDEKGMLWCSTKVESGTNKHVKGNFGFCPDSCDKSCVEDKTCTHRADCPEVNAEFERYKTLGNNSPERPKLRSKLKSLVCNKKPKKFCCSISISTIRPPAPSDTEIVNEKGRKKLLHPRSCQRKSTTNFLGNILPETGRCGLSCNTDARVVRGEDAKLGEFPWAALLGYQSARKRFEFSLNRHVIEKFTKYKCGGSLINTWYVLTAAHCHQEGIRHKEIHQVVLGEWELPDNSLQGQQGSRLGNKDPDCAGGNICLPKVQKILVDKVIIHEDYNKTSKVVFYDIALVRLKTEAVLNDGVQLACLPLDTSNLAIQLRIKDFRNGLGGYTGTVIGWGHTRNYGNGDFSRANVAKTILQKAKLTLRSENDCQRLLQNVHITQNHLCAGGGTEADSCNGDSGGGIFIKKNTSDHTSEQLFGYVQVGLVSSGSNQCGIGYPGVYTRVSAYISWIYQNMEP